MEHYKIIKLSFLRNKKEVLVKFDNDTTLELPLDLVISFSLNKGSVCSQEKYDKILKELSIFKVQKVAYRKATSSLKTRFELKRILLQKGYPEDEIDIAINKLVRLNIIDDEKFAKTAIEYYSSKKMYGLNRIKRYLKQKGVPQDIVDKVISEESTEEDQDELILNYYERNIEKIRRKPVQLRVPYCFRMLYNAGFSGDAISKFLNILKPEILGL